MNCYKNCLKSCFAVYNSKNDPDQILVKRNYGVKEENNVTVAYLSEKDHSSSKKNH